MQKEHHRFRPLSRPENKKSGFRTAGLPSESPKLPDLALFLPKMLKETPSVVVDKRRFFYGPSVNNDFDRDTQKTYDSLMLD